MTPAVLRYIDELRGWLDLPDPSHILLVLAAAATAHDTGEPLWLLLVAPPSSGKTEAVGLLGGVADARLDDITPAGLLGWTRGRESKPSGVLTRIDSTALITIGDLSTLLASSDRGARDQVFAILRRAYDGEVSRDVSPPGKAAPDARLHWTGRLTVVGAVTGAIDRYAAHADELGARWLYYRLAERDIAARRRASRAARSGNLDEHRRAARSAAANIIATAAGRLARTEVPDDMADDIEDAALVTCWGRAAVPRHGYGRREIDGLSTIEDPPRVVRQLHTLARGLLALGLDAAGVTALVRRVALDSMPAARYAVLTTLTARRGETIGTRELAREAGINRGVAYRNAEELDQIGVATAVYDQTVPDDDGPVVGWRLDDRDGKLVADVILQVNGVPGWSRKVGMKEIGEIDDLERRESHTDPSYVSGPPHLQTFPTFRDHPAGGCRHDPDTTCLDCYLAAQHTSDDQEALAALVDADTPPDDPWSP